MRTSYTHFPAAFLRFGFRRLAIGLFVIALLVVFLFPNAHPVRHFVTIASIIGTGAATLCGLTFWSEARLRIARFLNSRHLTFRYKMVRRNAALVALAGLSFWLVRAEVSGTRAKTFYNRGVAYAEKGEYGRAIEAFDRAIALQPKYADAFYSRGTSYLHKREWERAIQDFDRAIALKPDRELAFYSFYNRGLSYGGKGEYDRAIQDFDRAIKLNPQNPKAFYYRAVTYEKKGERERAIKDHDQAIHDYDHAIHDYDQVLLLKPGYADALHNRGVAYLAKGEYDRAIQDFDQTIALKPTSAVAFYNRGLAYGHKGNFDRSISNFDQALKL